MDVDAKTKMINNSTFEDECDIGKSVTEWTKNYNKKHGGAIINILQESHYGGIYITLNRAIYTM